jgi:hypothetical protein
MITFESILLETSASVGIQANIVTKDSSNKETWIYDKIATEASYSKSNVYGTILILGFSRDAGAVSSSQKTLTVVIKFNEKNLVESFSYHASKF